MRTSAFRIFNASLIPALPAERMIPPARPPVTVPPPPWRCLVRTGPPRKGRSSAVSCEPQAPPRPATGRSPRRPLCQEPRCRGLHDRCCFPFPGTPSLGIRSDTLGQADSTPATGCSKWQAESSSSPSTSEGLSAVGRAIVNRQATQSPLNEPDQPRPGVRPLAFRMRPEIRYRRPHGWPCIQTGAGVNGKGGPTVGPPPIERTTLPLRPRPPQRPCRRR